MQGFNGFPFFGSFGQPARMFEQRSRRLPGPFEKSYKCYPLSFIDKSRLENGNKVVLPQSALHDLASSRVAYPMQFELHNPSSECKSHCGVHEFTADEGMVYMPYWMMQNMLLQEGDPVKIKNVSLTKGNYVKLRPHTREFLLIRDPKDVLEKTLRNFSCLTTNDTIIIPYEGRYYYLDVIETRPSPAISVIDTDCEVDITLPLDHTEPRKVTSSRISPTKEASFQEGRGQDVSTPTFAPFNGVARQVGSRPANALENNAPCQTKDSASQVTKSMRPKSATAKPVSENIRSVSDLDSGLSKDYFREQVKHTETTERPNFKPFTGRKYSLNG